ncbi:MAG: cell division protein ZapA [Bacteroidales bacterium]|nr:cell division protein ZapA [Lentimicrobiaceae bacterium]MBQ2907594.1 cell division protein ZapA [Bacteroidales bacterium]MBQ3595174.1 cell division protein ZapA [Bacteroidales bacterium]MBR3915309.1 cell division protein ZapA [Bacteroidales bacterium]
MSEDEIRINVTIAERSYRMVVKKTDEKKVMQAAEKINESVKSHKQAYDYRDYQDLLSMVCLQLATLNVKYESDAAYKDQYLEQKLDEMSDLLNENINAK